MKKAISYGKKNPEIPVFVQEAAIRKYCKKNGFKIKRTLSILFDECITWDTLEIVACTTIQYKADTVIAYSKTMLSQDKSEAQEIIRVFKNCIGIQFEFVQKSKAN